LTKELAQIRLHRSVTDDHESPVLEVAPTGRVDRGVEETRDQLVGDVPVLHAPHCPRRVERLEDVHSPPLVTCTVTAGPVRDSNPATGLTGAPPRPRSYSESPSRPR